MTREEAMRNIQEILDEATEEEDSVCYVTSNDAEALRMAIEALKAQEWRTGKPTKSGKYMVTLDAWGHRFIGIMHYAKPIMPNKKVNGMCWYRYDDEWGDVVYDDKDIFAWMPLTEPYKAKSEDKE